MSDIENVVIIGSGCAGMTAAIYCARGELNPLVIEGIQPGGQLTTTSDIENFPGFESGVNGYELVDHMRKQAEKFGARFVSDVVESVNFSAKEKKIICRSGEFITKTVIIATGASPRMMGVPGEQDFFGGRGVSVCATCDAPFFKGKTVAVIGGGDSACEEALFLSNFCTKIFIIHRRDALRASRIMAERVLKNTKIEVVWNSVLTEVDGGNRVDGIKIKDVQTSEIKKISCDGVFLAIGHIPNTDPFKPAGIVDDSGYIRRKSGSFTETDISGVFAAGDCTDPLFRQAITAAGTGCMAAISVERFLRGQ